MKTPHLENRNRIIREQFNDRRERESSQSIMESIAERFYLSLATVKQIIYDKTYGEAYEKNMIREVQKKKGLLV